MRYLVGFVFFLLALGTLRVVGCDLDLSGAACDGDEDCNDGNECTADSCSSGAGCGPVGCRHRWVEDGTACTLDGRGGVCIDGRCEESPCEGVVCDDGIACTGDTCDYRAGSCVFTNLCDDGDPCTKDTCNPSDGMCDFTALEDGANCFGVPPYIGICKAGVCLDLPTDACMNAEDLGIVCDPGFVDAVETCARDVFPDSELAPLCLVDVTAVSADCASCYGAALRCIFQNCFAACESDPESQECDDCQTAFGCDTLLTNCTGDLPSACDV